MPFGDKKYCLYILPELNDELAGRKLQSKFPWVNDEEFAKNRKHFLQIGKKQKKSIQQTFAYVWEHVQTELLGPSRVDAWYIAYALELGVPVVTDDQDMSKLAKDFDVEVISTLELLKIMLDSGHTDMSTIKGLVDYWEYTKDNPANFKANYQHLLGNKQA